MIPETRSLFDAALALPEADRALLAERLLETLSPEADEMSDEDLLAELDRRRTEVERGTARLIPWSELRLEE